MKNRLFFLYKKELFLLLISPLMYGAAIIFLTASAFDYLIIQKFFLLETTIDIRFYFASLPYISVIIIPSFTMTLWADEFSQGNLNANGEFLCTLPVTEKSFVLSKWAAVVTIFCGILLVSFLLPLSLRDFMIIDFRQIFCSYIGLFFFFCAAIALGQFVSLVLSNQMLSYIVCALILFVCNSIHFLPLLVKIPVFIQAFTNQLSFAWHFDSASKGIFDTRDIIFYCTITAFFLYASVFKLKKAKW